MIKFNKKKLLKELQKAFKELKERYFNLVSLFFLLGFVLFYALFNIFPSSTTYKIVSIWFVFGTYLAFCIYNHWRYSDWKDHIFTDVFYLIIIFTLALGFTAISVNDVAIGVQSVFLLIFVIYGGFVIISTTSFFRASRGNDIPTLIMFYTVFVASIILLFTTFYALLPTESSKLTFTSNSTRVTEFNDILYFSASNFYSSTYGDIIPLGDKMKLISLIQVLISFIVHVIVISRVVPTPRT